MSEPKTTYQMTQNMADYDPAIDQPLEHVIEDFGYDATSCHVPTGMAMLKFAALLEALDWHAYSTGKITLEEARAKIKWAADLMDKKFDIEYRRLPQ
jgi:hypothetical protein